MKVKEWWQERYGLQPLEKNKSKYIQVVFDPRGRELVSSYGKIKSFTRT